MGESETTLIDMLGRERARLRERTLPALAAALAIQIRAASAGGRYDLRAISSAVGIVVLLLAALAAATVDALLAIVATSVGEVFRTRVRFGPAPVFSLPPPITDDMLLDKRGRPLRGAPRMSRMAMLERQRAEIIALAAAAAPAHDLRVVELPPLPPRLVAAYARTRQLAAAAAVSLARARARVAPAYARVRSAADALVALVPVPTLPLRWVRVIAVTTTMTFVFATALGTTGLITQQGRVALGASTTLSIIAGDVSATDPGSADLKPVSDGTLLRAGMTIRTGDASYAVLTYFEGSTVSLEPNTTLLIEALESHPDGTTVISMQQQLGKTWHSVTKLLNQGSKYEVKTPTLTATVRGTAFEVGVAQTAAGELVSSVVTTEGAVGAVKPVTPADPTPAAEVIVPAGFQTTATGSAPVAPAEPAPEPERKVTVTIGTANAVVVDPLGRANGEKDGKLVLQTPGAKVTKVDGKLVVTLPNVPDGRISTVIAPSAQAAAPVSVATVVAEKGKGEARSEETIQVPANAGAPATVTGIEVKRSDSAQPADVRVLRTEEKKDAPAPKVVEPVKPTPRPEMLPTLEKKEEPKNDGGSGTPGRADEAPAGSSGRVSNVVDVFVKATLPPLSIEDASRRAEEARKAEEKAREEAAKREEERRKENEKRAEEARKAEEKAREEAEKRAQERRVAEEKAREELSKRDTGRAEQAARGGAATPPDAGLVQNILRAINPGSGDDEARKESEKRAEEARKAEAKAREEAEKRAEERRKAEEASRSDQIKKAEEERKQAEKRAEELRKAEEKAKEEAAKQLERVREIEAKAREQAQKLEEEKRKEAEKRLEEFRKAEEKAREEAQKRLEEQRRAEEKAKEEAEKRIEELRRAEERAQRERQAAEEERRRDEERRRSEGQREREDRRSNFVPPTIDPLPGNIGNAGRGGSGRP